MNTEQKPPLTSEEELMDYIGTKRVKARPMSFNSFLESMGKPIAELDEDGYVVVYPDGYISWSPRHAFETAYVKTKFSFHSDGRTFGEALEWIRSGEFAMRLPRWGGDVKIIMELHPELCNMTHPFLYVQSRFGRIPWAPTQVELLSEEWQVVL